LRSWLLTYFEGMVICQIRGKQIHSFINYITKERFSVWNIRFRSEDTVTLYMTIADFFLLRSILKKFGCRVHVLRRMGFPFLLLQWRRRKFFVAGGLMFVIALVLLTSMVWKIEVTGTEKITNQEVLQIAQQIGVRQGQFKFRMPPLDDIKKIMVQNLEGAAWVGVEITGTKVKFEIVERVMPEKREYENPRNLISSRDAIIVKILAETGQPMVRVNQRVKKGEVLINGLLGEDPENQKVVVAKGTVEGLVWYRTQVTLPMIQKRKEYTGNYMDRAYLVIGNRALKTKGYKDIPFAKYESKWDEKTVKWRDYRLPVRWMDEKVLEVTFHENRLKPDEAVSLAKERARANVLVEAEAGAQIFSEKVLHQDVQNDKVVLTMLFEVVEDIASEQPIIRGE
jgi:similar to stage IV sporulation protein